MENVVLQCGAVLNSPHGHLSGNYLRTFDLPPPPATQVGRARTLCHTSLYVTRAFPPSSALWFHNGAKSREGGRYCNSSGPCTAAILHLYREDFGGSLGIFGVELYIR